MLFVIVRTMGAGSMNPARSLGPAVIYGHSPLHSVWVFFAGIFIYLLYLYYIIMYFHLILPVFHWISPTVVNLIYLGPLIGGLVATVVCRFLYSTPSHEEQIVANGEENI